MSAPSALDRARAWLFHPVDNSALILFRISFGLLIVIESAGSIFTGWVGRVYVEPTYTFPHMGFEWLRFFHGPGVYAYYAFMAFPALLVMLGARFRLSIIAFTAMWTVVYLGQTASYNNHYYLLILLGFLLALTPANADLSWDAEQDPALRSSTCPRWCIAIFIAQIAIVYIYASIAKLNGDWLAGRPVQIWLAAKTHYPVLGPLYREEWLRWMIVYGGIAFDGLVVPLLLWKRTRFLGVALSVFFHLFNSYTFRVGIFPYMGIAFCLFFFPGEDLRRWVLRGRQVFLSRGAGLSPARQKVLLAVLTVFIVIQVGLPLRHYLYPGNSQWTEEGHRMSWQMMLRAKSGSITFRVVDPVSRESWRVDPSDMLSEKQGQRIGTRPDMIWQFVQILRQQYAQEGREVQIFARSWVSLNGRRPQALVDPDVDLSRASWTWVKPLTWLVPLEE
jgi:vitamin K-dependent gamma-carboxylase